MYGDSDAIRAQVEAFVERMYTVALGRAAEQDGLEYWTNLLLTHKTDGANLANCFILSEEFFNQNYSNTEFVNAPEFDKICTAYGISRGTLTAEMVEIPDKNTTDEEFIQAMYKTFMDRDAEPDGMSFWKNHLNSGTTRETVMSGFAQSVVFKGIMASYGL